jgi:hypothetical protein
MDRAFSMTSASRASRFSRESSPIGPVCRYVIATITLLRYPHGKFRGGMAFSPLFPTFTSSSWRENNILLLEYDI